MDSKNATTTTASSASREERREYQGEMQQKDLYGGAIKTKVPSRFFDASEVRQVPDHQEVFTDSLSDQALIFEIVSLVSDVSNEESARFHFKEIAVANDSSDQMQIVDVIPLTGRELPSFRCPHNFFASAAVGTQMVSKFREAARNTVKVFVGVIRVPHIETEILISLTTPLSIHPESSSSRTFVPNSETEDPSALFFSVLSSFSVIDWGLFCP